MRHKITHSIRAVLLLFTMIILSNNSHGTVTVLKATGGTSLSADKAANATSPAWTTLGVVRLTEGSASDFSTGTNLTLTLTAPTGWSFNTAAAVTATCTASRDITSPTILSITSTVVTAQFNVTGFLKSDILNINGLQIRANDGANVTSSVNIVSGGTATISGCAAGTNLGLLSEVAGVVTNLFVTFPGQTFTDASTVAASGNTGTVTTQTSGTSFIITRIRALDQFKNVVTSYTGSKTIVYSGPATAVTAPAYITNVSFASGVSSTTLTTTLKKAETTTITVTDGVYPGITSSSITVNPGVLNNFAVQNTSGTNIGSQIASTAFNIKLTARDAENNTCNAGTNNFTGTADITSTGTLSGGSGTTPAFTAGVLASRSVTISNTGTFTITATKSGGGASGVSNSFAVDANVLNNFLVQNSAGASIGTQIAGTSFNIKITARDANNNILSSGPNVFTGTVDLTSTGTISAGGGTTTSFTAGVLASTGITISNTGSFTITATKTGGGSSGVSNSFSVTAGMASSFLVEASAGGNIGTQIAATSFTIKITAYDANNNICNSGANSFTGTVDLTSTGTLSIGSGTTPAFTAGVLASRTVAISNTGSFTITATKTGGGPNGTSNSFTVNPGVLNNFLLEASGGGNIGSQTAGSSFNIMITARDANNNTCNTGPNNFTGTVDITSSGTLVGGSGTTSSFSAGVLTHSVNISTVGNFTITAVKSGGGASGVSNSFLVTAGPVSSFLVEAAAGGAIGTQITGIPFLIKLTARDQYNNVCNSGPNSFTGTADISSTGDISAGILTGAFTAGVLSSHSLTISDAGNFPVIATRTSGSETGISNSFAVNNVMPGLTLISPNCITTGGPDFVLDVTGSNFNLTTVVKFNGSARTTTYISPTHIQGDISAADIASPGIFTITTYNFGTGGGTSSSTTLNLNTSSIANPSICQGASYLLPDGISQNTTGTYISHIPNAKGCDSVITTNLTVIPNSTFTANITICNGATYVLPDGVSQTTSGTYMSHIPNSAGCDSTITTNLTVIPNSSSTANISICNGATYVLPDGVSQTTAGTYMSHIPNVAGCDSAITTNLTVIPNSSSTANISICNGATYVLPDGVSQTTSGTYMSHIPNAAGCDSAITTNLTVIPNSSSTANISICNGAIYFLPDGVSQTTSGTYMSHIPNAAGCDSAITTNLTVIPNSSSTANISICNGATYVLPDGVSQTTSGTYMSHIPNAAGCDSAITTNLTVILNSSSTANISICNGATYVLPDGISQATSGTYMSHIPNTAGCDSAITTNLTVIPNSSSTTNVSICQGYSYLLPDGIFQNTTGTYISIVPNVSGCDSTITTNLTVIPNSSSTANISICQGYSYLLPNGVFQNTTGTYVSHIPNAAGCDSSITTNLTVVPNSISTANISICQGATYVLPDGFSQNTSGTYISHIPNTAGCDSAITTNLTVIPNTSSTANISICQGSSYTLPDGVSQNSSGSYISYIPNAAGCDSMITTNLSVIPNSSSTANISICNGATYVLPDGVSQTTSGTYMSHITNAAGCDSAITTNLTVIPNSTSTANISICNGATYVLPDGVSQTTSGTYMSHIPNVAGCDSAITTNLTVIPNTSSTENISICNGATYVLPDGVSQTTSGTYMSHIPNAAGCDSAITTNLTVIPNSSSTANISICNGATYVLPDGVSQTTSGTYMSHIPNAAGCDSAITTNLTVLPNSSSTANISICNGATYVLPDGVSQTTSGTYMCHIPNAAGCDSAITTNLTVIPNSSSTANISICNGATYVLPDGVSQTTSGTYMSHIPNAAGCDSAITTNLTVIPNSSSTANISICNGATYVLPDGISQTTSGTYMSHIPNVAGCDSAVTTNLTVIPNSSSTANISICNGATYVLPDGVSQTTSGTYMSHIPNVAGCDSAITTNLTVIPNSSSTANISICNGATYVLPDGVSQTTSGTYMSHITNAAGCDSAITTNLTVIPNSSSTANISICNGATYVLPDGVSQTTSGTYMSHILNAAGCDSAITTNLTVIPNSTSTANISICNGATYVLPDGVSQTTSGTFMSHILNAAGCDSAITTNLTVIPNSTSTANISICNGATYVLPDGVSQNTTGTYMSHIPNVAGCDSAITTNLTVIPNSSSTANISICNGATYVLPDGVSQNTTGTYMSHIPNVAGCDSAITTNLTVIPNSSSTANISICNGATYVLPDGVSQTTSGTYMSHILNAAGCDSAITTNLTVIPNSSSTANISICNGATYVLPDGISQTTSGTYMSHIPNAAGCDSAITTNLTVIPNSSSTANISICNGATYLLPDGVSQTTSGTYMSHIPNVAGCDSAVTTNLTVIPNSSSTANISICNGATYVLPDGISQTTSGTFMSHIPNAAGCDSAITTNLTVIPNSSSTANISICNGASYVLPDGVSQTTSGTYMSHILNAAGCDSAITTNLTVIPNSTSTANISICNGATYVLPDGVSQTTSGTYMSHIPNVAGCDSAITTNLTVIPNTSSTANISICNGATYVLPDGVSQTTSGTYMSHIPNAAGCDSAITTNLTVIPNSSSTANISICNGATYVLPDGISQTTSGTYMSHIPNAEGCDSAITTNLTVIPNSSSTANISICNGATYVLPDGVSQTTSGTYMSHIPNAAGCDSAITTNLTVIPNSSSTANISICNGATYVLPDGVSQITSGTYISHIPNAAGCDSAITTNLTVIPNSSSTANISICNGAAYVLPDGVSQTTSGTYMSHIPNAAGCDSAITTNLTVIPNSSSTANISICNGATYVLPDGVFQNTTGTYMSHIPNVAGCDSAITTNLTVIPNSSSTANISICNGATYVLPDGVSQTTSGTYMSHIPNAAGCDSAITTNLTVIPNSSSTANISICNGATYVLPDGVSQNTTGTYMSHIPNAAGCDSAITTNLTVIPNSSSTANISICNGASYVLPDGVSQTTSGTYMSHIPNVAGCDSAVTTNLTVIPNSSSTANISICNGASYVLPDGVSQTTSGTYMSHIPNVAGCDSAVTTNLTVIPNSSSTANISICNGATYVLPDGISQTTSGTYMSHIPNAAGCDSAITTNLTMIPNSSSTANISICNGATYVLPDGISQTTSGTYMSHIPNVAGCDSAITTNLTVIPNSSSTANISICNGATYVLPDGISQTTSGTYMSHIPNVAGCDSAITTNLTVIPNSSSTANISINQGSTYILPDGIPQTSSGVYISYILNAAGCDSVITTNLSVIPNSSSTANVSICQGNTYILPDGVPHNTTGTYISHIPNAAGADSVITTNLTVIPNTSSSVSVSICQGSTYVLPNGVSQSTAGVYESHIPNAAGCDSAITTTLSIKANSSSTNNVSICMGSVYVLPNGVSQSSSGTYISHLSNAAGCDSVITTNLTVTAAPDITGTPQQITCFGNTGSVILNTTGGTPPYFFGPQTTTGLAAGNYTYYVSDNIGCSDTVLVTINAAPAQLVLDATVNQIGCNGGVGSVTLNATGGTPSYIYGGDPISNLATGTYYYTVTDNNGCQATDSAYINTAPSLLAATSFASTIPCGQFNGTASVTVLGGTPPYDYVWSTSPVQTTQTALGLHAGNYVCTFTDANGCTGSKSAMVKNSNPPACTITGTPAICPGSSTTLTAPANMIDYIWSNGATTRAITVTNAGLYTVTITNATFCANSSSITAIAGVAPVCSITGNGTLCPGSTLTLRAPTGYSAYTWSTGSVSSLITVSTGGTYTVTVKNSSGCTSTCNTVVTPPLVNTVTPTNGVCSNTFLGSVVSTPTNGTPPYAYLWNTGATTNSITGITTTASYNVRVTDANGCISTKTATVAITKATGDYASITANFNPNIVPANSYLWFSCVAKVNYTGAYPVTINFNTQNIFSSKFNINPASGKLILDSTVTQASTVYNGTEWITTAPPNLSGYYFIGGYPYKVPAQIAGNLTSIKWKGIWTASSPCVTSVDWKWSAAVYTNFTLTPASIQVKPVDDAVSSQYNNSDLAGTPENYKIFVMTGAMGTGGTNYTGTFTPMGTRVPCSGPATCPTIRYAHNVDVDARESLPESGDFVFKAYPNPFSSIATIEFERRDKSDHVVIEIYDMFGRRVRTIFDETIDQGEKYAAEFDASNLENGMYFYRIISSDRMDEGKIILRK